MVTVITWNELVQGEFMNDFLRDSLSSQNPCITFAPSNEASAMIGIVLPYAAFGLIAGNPLMESQLGISP